MFALLDVANPLHVNAVSGTFRASELVTRAHLDPADLVVVVAAGWYLRARRRAGDAGDRRPPWQAVCYLGGLFVVAAVTSSGLASMSTTNLTVHLVNDGLLVVVAPALLVLGAPLSVALSSAGPRAWARIMAALHSPLARVVTNPVVAWVLLGGGLVAYYFSGLLTLTLEHRAVADTVDLGLVVVGGLFCWPTIALDPAPRAGSSPSRVVTLFLALPYFTVLGMALASQNSPVSPGLSVDELHTGAGVLGSVGSLIGILAALAVLAGWVRKEESSLRRPDATDDAEAAAQVAFWRATREAIATEAALARAPVVKARPGPDQE